MNLVSRYVEQVKRYLPDATRNDTGRELESLIQDDLEAFQEQHGRAPDDDEIAERLRRLGHPYKVAMGYRARRGLISEKAYPLYRRMLASTLCTYVLVDVILTLFVMVNDQRPWALQHVPQFFHSLADVLLFGFALITAVFHYYGDALSESAFLWRFDPKKLPAVETRWANVDVVGSFIGVVTSVFCLALVTASRYGYSDNDFSLQLAPMVVALLWPMRLLLLIQLVVHLVNMFQRYWTRTKVLLLSGCTAAISVLLLLVILTPHILQIHIAQAATDVEAANRWASWWPDLTLRVTLAIIAARGFYRSTKSFKSTRKATMPSV